MAVVKTTFVCPFCFDVRKISDVQFRCNNKRCPGGEVDDVELTRYENGDVTNPIKAKYYYKSTAKVGIPTSEPCPQCKSVSYSIICPSCHNKLPRASLEGKDTIISIVGSRATGKSHFVTVIINELLKRVAPSFGTGSGGAMEGFDTTLTRYMGGAYQRLYNERQKLDLTKSSVLDVNNDAFRPYIFTLKIPYKKLFKDVTETCTLVFFDTAGEDLNDADTMSTVNKYICKSAGIIFLLDPMQIPAVRNQLDDSTVSRASAIDPSSATAADDIMTRVSELIRNDKKMKPTDKIDIPVAAVFSKFDAIADIIPDGSTILEPSTHCSKGEFDMNDWHNVDSEVQALLTEWGEQSFISQVNVNYSNCSFFVSSALGLGNNPKPDGSVDMPRPHRIEDAILWLLKENGIIKSGK